MRRKIGLWWVIMLLAACLAGCGKETATGRNVADKTEITDMIGRKVTVPRNITKVYGTNPMATMLLYSLEPAKIAGEDSKPGNLQKSLAEKRRSMSGQGQGGMLGAEGTRANMEKILQTAPDVIVTVTASDMDDGTIGENADRLQAQLRIPVVVISSSLTELDRTYTFLGELLGNKERAKELADYCRHTIREIGSLVAAIPEEKRVRVYYAEGATGLATEPSGSRHVEVLDLVRGINVAQVPLNPGSGQNAVSLEKVMLWNPDVIIINKGNGGTFDYITHDDRWANIKAVKEHRLYEVPDQPYNWFDRPPSVNRLLGIKWLANLLYPDYVKLDIKSEAKQFYRLFFHYELTDREAEDLLRRSSGK